jgi:Ca2+-binding EF-hand superfamily protein
MVSGISSFNTASLQNMFKKIDTNSDESIDKTEMSAFIQQNASDLVNEIFSQQDTDQDSLISQIEANSGMEKLGQEMKKGAGMSGVTGQPPPPPQKVFDTADTNEDGVVSKDELAAAMGQSGGNIDDIFSQVDTDGDGLISRAEDDAWLKKMDSGMGQNSTLASAGSVGNAGGSIFAKSDVNGDGSVSKAELAAVIGKDVDSLFGKIDTDGDGSISQSEDAAWMAKTDEQVQKAEASNMGNITSSGEDWRSIMFSALLKSLIATSDSSATSTATSLYA